MELYAHQKQVLEINKPKWLLAMDLGTGKSLTAMELAKKNNCKRILLVCPKSLKEKWKRDMLQNLLSPVHFQIMSKEEFSKDYKNVPYYDCVIIDEAHYFSGMKSQMYKRMALYLKNNKPPFVWLLTATPYMSTPWNIYALANLLGVNWSYMGFKEKFFYEINIAGKYAEKPMFITKPRPNIEPEIATLVNKIGFTVRIDECADVPEQVYETEYFKFTKEQLKGIEEVKADEIDRMALFTKIHQIENGTLKGNGYLENKIFKSDKIDRIVDLVEQNKKIAIICRYNLQIGQINTILAEKFPNLKLFVINGETKNKDEIVQEVEKSEQCAVLINASCAEGYELGSVGLILFASLSFSYVHYKQITGRFLRINKLKRNVYIHLVTKGEGEPSIDEAVLQSIMNKQDFHMELFAEQYREYEKMSS